MSRTHTRLLVLAAFVSLVGSLFAADLSARPLHAQTGGTVPPPPAPTAIVAMFADLYLPLVLVADAGSSERAMDAAAAAPLVNDAAARRILLPVVQIVQPVYRIIDAIPIAGAPTDRPAAINGDLNLALRGYTVTNAAPTLIDIGGPTDNDAPQLAALFAPARAPIIAAVYRVNEWNWACGANGCRGTPIAYPPVTLVALSTQLGEKIFLPARDAEIYTGGYKALVLFADERRITLKYTREDSPVWGYMIHLEEIGVDPSIVHRYRALDAAGRGHLPALRSGDLVGYAIAPTVKVAIRDTGMFMDPRTRKDWWKGW